MNFGLFEQTLADLKFDQLSSQNSSYETLQLNFSFGIEIYLCLIELLLDFTEIFQYIFSDQSAFKIDSKFLVRQKNEHR